MIYFKRQTITTQIAAIQNQNNNSINSQNIAGSLFINHSIKIYYYQYSN
jgi:hypothetical protein